MQTLIAYVENKPGVLNRVSSLARRLAINIDSLTVGPTDNEEIARMTIVAHTDERGAHRLEASLEKLIDGLLEVLRPFGVLEMARSGRIAMTRGGDLLRPPTQAPTATAEALLQK
jgi:acetolactate synthase small subunit